MSEALCNGYQIIHGNIHLPKHGVWTADILVDHEEAITGAVTITITGIKFYGTVRRGGIYQTHAFVHVVGGANGMHTEVPARTYQNVTPKLPITDVLREAGETLSSTHDASLIIGVFWQNWVRTRGKAATALQTMLDDIGASWRILGDGTIWIGMDAWVEDTTEGLIKDDDPSIGCALVWTDQPVLRPGTTWQGRRLSYVVHSISESKSLTEIWYE